MAQPWKVVSIKAPAALIGRAKRKAGKSGLGEYLRGLIAADLGEEPPVAETGLAGASERTRARVAKSGAKTRWKKTKKIRIEVLQTV